MHSRPLGLSLLPRLSSAARLAAGGLVVLLGAAAWAQPAPRAPAGGQAGVFVAGPINPAPPGAGVAAEVPAGEAPAQGVPALGAEVGALEEDQGVIAPVRLGEARPDAPLVILTPEATAAVAIANSLDLQISAANVRDAESQVKAALGLDDFTVQGSASYVRAGTGLSLGGSSGALSEGVSVSRPLYNESRIRLQQQAALESLGVTKIRQAVTELALDLTARQAAFEVLRTNGLLDVAVEQQSALVKHLTDSQNLFEGGQVAWFEVVQAQTEVARAQGAVVTARANLEHAGAQLRRVLTFGESSPIEVRPGGDSGPPPGTREELVQRALKDRPEVEADRASLGLAETDLSIARRISGLNVNLSGSVSNSDTDGGGNLRWQVGVSANKPFSDGRARASGVGSATARRDVARTNLRQTEEDVRLQVVNAQTDLEAAREALTVAKQGVVEARERLAIARVRFETQYSAGIEVVDAQSSLTQARIELVNAGFAVQVAAARLRMSVGMKGPQGEPPMP